MSEPIAEQIMATIRTRVATAFEANRSTRVATWVPRDQTTSIEQVSIVANEELSCPGNPPAQGWTLDAAVIGIVRPSDRDTVAVDTYKNRMGADIIKAVTSPSQWYTWGGLAINTDLGDVESYKGEDGSGDGVVVRLLIHFRTSEYDPYAVRV